LGSIEEVGGPDVSKVVKWQRNLRYERGIDETDAFEVHISAVERFKNLSGRAPSRGLAVEGEIEYDNSNNKELAGSHQ
jgi:hypothetical protein